MREGSKTWKALHSPGQHTRGVGGVKGAGKREVENSQAGRVADLFNINIGALGDGGPTASTETDEAVPLFPRALSLYRSAGNCYSARAPRGWLCLVSRILELGRQGA